jgi:protein TonB
MTPVLRLDTPPMPAASRQFWGILAFSLAIHALLFALTSWQRQHGPISLPPILASIRLVAASEPGQVATPVPATAAAYQKARQEAIRTERPAPRNAQTDVPANASTLASSPDNAAGENLAPALLAAPADTARPAPAVATQRPQSDVLDSYRQRLGEFFARHQEYPRVAAMRGWEGEVRLRLKVARKGNLIGVALEHSSGFDVLDRHALAMLEALAALPPLPDALEANEISVVVPVNYRLKKST